MTLSAPRRFPGPLLGPAAALRLTLGLATLGLVTLGLAACAPATRASTSAGALFMPGGQQLALICASRGRVTRGGALVWDSGAGREYRQAPYLLSCRDYTLQSDGATLSVQDDTLQKALTHFDPDARFLAYAPGLSVRFPQPGLIDADPPGTLSDGLQGVRRGASVMVSQSGAPGAQLLGGETAAAVRYDPARPVTLSLKGAGGPVAWPEVTIEANKGLITALIYR